MVAQKFIVGVTFMVLFTLLDQAKPGEACLERKVKKLTKTVKELENRISALEKCKRKKQNMIL